MLPILGRIELTFAGIFVNFNSPTQTCFLESIADNYLKSAKAAEQVKTNAWNPTNGSMLILTR
ncbi:hypothetical protein FHX09_005472 [Rhizobium sp. BK538]|nr:hypothetical protein [Rhizobium sp. BK538]